MFVSLDIVDTWIVLIISELLDGRVCFVASNTVLSYSVFVVVGFMMDFLLQILL